MEKYKVGVIGGTGMVGQRFVTLMENHPWFELAVIAASPRSAGKTYEEAVGGRWAMDTPIPQQAKNMVVMNAEADVEKIASMVDFVFSAVDNMAARRKVNQLCVFSQTLLIDCASSGKFAQAVPVIPYRSECYECTPGSEPTGPKITCTIRSTPENFEHCAAWAFHLFNSMYAHNESTDVITVSEGRSPFQAVFVDRIIELQGNSEMWKNRNPPSVVDINVESSDEPISRPRDVWSDEESVAVFKYVSQTLKPPLTFDKDDVSHLAFTTAAANLQARAFSIEKRYSMFDAKSLVSVVEPALATTNSTISAIAVLLMDRMLKGENVKSVWMAHDSKGPRLSPANLSPPNPKCPVCGIELYKVTCNFLSNYVSEIGKAVGASAPSIIQGKKIIYDADDDSGEKTVKDAGIVDGDIIFVSDLDGDDSLIGVIVKSGDKLNVEHLRSVEKKAEKVESDSSDEYSDIIEIKC